MRTLLPTALLLALTGIAGAQSIITYTENTGGSGNIAMGYPVPQPVDSLTPVDGFRSYAGILARWQDLALTHDFVTAIKAGSTRAGRDVWSYVVADGDGVTAVDGTPSPAVMIVGGTHAREWQGYECVTGWMERIVGGRGGDGLFDYLVENVTMVFIPVLNVDGNLQTARYFNQTVNGTRDGRMRRKNMRDVDEVLSTFNDYLFGVDLNRNNPVGFGNASSSPTAIDYHGPSASSEPETQALQFAALSAPPSRLRLYVDMHSYTKLFYVVLTGNSRRDAITQSLVDKSINAIGTVNGSRYTKTSAPLVGATDEYFGHTYQIPSWTLETEPRNGSSEYGGNNFSGSGFVLPNSQIARVREDTSRAAFLGMYHQAGPPAIHRVRVVDAASSAVVQESQWNSDGDAARTLSETISIGLTPGGTYRIEIAFNKPMRWRDGGAVANYPGQSITLAPTVRLTGTDRNSQPVSITAMNTQWLGETGYLQYRDDTVTVEFTLPMDIALEGGDLLTLEVSTTDFAGLALDANPATIVDWGSGAWLRYENTAGTAGDTGGTDRSITMQITFSDSATSDYFEIY